VGAAPGVDGLDIKLARIADVNDFSAYVLEHVAESGVDGSPIFALSRTVVRDDIRTRSIERWSRDITEALWGRAWILWASNPRRVVGHIELIGGRVPAELHRAILGMGIRRAFTGRGHGGRLMNVAVAWARIEAKLAWIDLGVFANNAPARKLYARMGFVETGYRNDAFRVEGNISIDDIQMSLEL
jgi:RimJ/RimL family protein N-acetyltransferase